MTRLRKMMLEELQRRNFAESTTEAYIRAVKEFSQYFNSSPDRLGPRHIREYQASLFQKRKFSPNTVAQHLAVLRFFYIKTLKKAWSITETPYPKRAVRLPTILSQEEVTRLIDAAHPPLHRTLLMTLYATGLRRAELAHLKVSDVDSQRMVIHVQGGKGRKDRDVLLSPKLLDELERHSHRLRPRSSVWLFPGRHVLTSDRPITSKVIYHACKQAARRAALSKKVPRRGRAAKNLCGCLKAHASRNCCTTQSALGFRVTLKCRIFRRSWPMTKKQYRTPNVSVGTVKKSIAAMASRWFLRNVSHRFTESGSLGARRIHRELLSESSKPSLSSSP